tara:strand:- start:141 stop:986 length:846 start_codon:yes stop_codon:yes gene_type:complete
MKINLHTLILPRLEIFFLEEWIDHHLQIGVSHIYLYNNGLNSPRLCKAPHWKNGRNWKRGKVRRLTQEEQAQKWDKKPDGDYAEELSDKEITGLLAALSEKYSGKLSFVPWEWGVDHHHTYPNSQRRAYRHCVQQNDPQGWWLCMDPDEYINLHSWSSLPDMASCQGSEHKIFRFYQKIFSERQRKKVVREISTWGYLLTHTPWKNLTKAPRFQLKAQDIHRTLSRCPKPRALTLHPTDAIIHHYRGDPETQGGTVHYKGSSPRDRGFNKIDASMDKYIIK